MKLVAMRAWNRAKLLWGYLRRKSALTAHCAVEYIVETTAKCNLYCPMCPRETHKQPKADMADEIFERLVRESGESAEHMMLIGLASRSWIARFLSESSIASATTFPPCFRPMEHFSMKRPARACWIRRSSTSR